MHKPIPGAARTSIVCACLGLVLSVWPGPLASQELEPRAYSVSLVKTNFVVLSNAYAAGDLTFDPSLPVEEAGANINTMVAGYFRSMNVLGRSGNFTLVVPYSSGTGTVEVRIQESESRSQNSQVRIQKSEVRSQNSEVRIQ
jgi:hypothetical protein